MKRLALFSAFLLLSCSAKKQGVVTTAALEGECPKNANCKIELLLNKGMVVKQDDFGKTYYELAESAATNVVKYEYSRVVKGNVQDAGYREEVVFEIEQNPDAIQLADKSLQNVKMLFGRFCFCKGQTGYYKIEKGTLTINGTKGTKSGLLNFQTDEVPQIIHNFRFTLK